MSQTNAQLLADSLGTASTGTVPIGGIILWSGSVAQINNLPGWALCNGGNGTPNLRNQFILGAYSDDASVAYPNVPPNTTGGSANAILVSHGHNFNIGGTARTTISVTTGVTESEETVDERGGEPVQVLEEVSASNSSISIVSNGSSATNANIPPYYSLAYIMRIS